MGKKNNNQSAKNKAPLSTQETVILSYTSRRSSKIDGRMLFCCYYALTRTDNFFPLPTDAEAGSLTNRWMRDTKQPMADGWRIGGSGPGKTPPATTTGQRTLEETLVWMREAGNQWKREVMLNAHQGLCCLASINIYPSPKTALDFLFFLFTLWNSKNNETYQSTLIVAATHSKQKSHLSGMLIL